MDVSGTKLVELAISFVKEAPGALLKMSNYREQTELERAIQCLRTLHFGPGGIQDWLDSVEASGGVVGPAEQRALRERLEETGKDVAASFAKLDAMSFVAKRHFATMLFSDYVLFRKLLIGKKSLRAQLSQIIDNSIPAGEGAYKCVDMDTVKALRSAVSNLNAEIESAHDYLVRSLRASRSKEAGPNED